MYQVTGENKYLRAAEHLIDQLENQPITSEGGYWHKKIYPYQMWLDGLYMAEPFQGHFAKITGKSERFDRILQQFKLIEKYHRDSETGLYHHGWDEKKEQIWADKKTGLSSNFWGRGMGWYGMALVDVLDYVPENHQSRKFLLDFVKKYALAVAEYQDSRNGLWWQVLNYPDKKGNYLEASVSCMFVYTLTKAVRKGYIKEEFVNVALRGFKGINANFIEKDVDGLLILNRICKVAGLGGPQQRDGTFEYYISEPIVKNDPKGVAPYILASIEIEQYLNSKNNFH